ncbi:MAG TPA: pyruvate formate lyase family protein, partial [Azospirillum sp.]|nr:pyruvate formate lyase family protein [Azospirillum sp.]
MDTLLNESLVASLAPSPTPDPWRGFAPGVWRNEVNVRDFIVRNVTPYAGDRAFLAGATGTTKALWDKVTALLKQERAAKGGVLDADTEVFSSIVAHAPGYIDKDLELIVGLQTDKPLKRSIMPFGGWRMVKNGLEAYGFT